MLDYAVQRDCNLTQIGGKSNAHIEHESIMKKLIGFPIAIAIKRSSGYER